MDFWKVVKIRRSIREFSKRPIPDRLINLILQAASLAPSGSNQQNWYFIVVKDNEMKERLKSAVVERIDNLSSKMGSNIARSNFVS